LEVNGVVCLHEFLERLGRSGGLARTSRVSDLDTRGTLLSLLSRGRMFDLWAIHRRCGVTRYLSSFGCVSGTEFATAHHGRMRSRRKVERSTALTLKLKRTVIANRSPRATV